MSIDLSRLELDEFGYVFRGEETYDAERAAFVEMKLIELCTGTDKELAHLKEKYAGEPEVLSKLNEYEIRIEPDPL